MPYQPGLAPPAVSTPSGPPGAWVGRTLFWLALLAGVGSVVVGVLMLVWPDATLGVAAVLFGLWLLVHGVLRIAEADADAGHALRAPSKLHAFNRYEIKYLVDRSMVGELRHELAGRMDLDAYAAGGGYGVWSVYCAPSSRTARRASRPTR
jgi:Short repeat of unknown function (DUF308)